MLVKIIRKIKILSRTLLFAEVINIEIITIIYLLSFIN